MKKQEYESLNKGDKLKIVSLDYTEIGWAHLEIGEVVEFVHHLESDHSVNDLRIKQSDGDHWFMSSKDLEVFEGEIEYKVGDEVIFLGYEGSTKWEEQYGGFVGEKYKINHIRSENSIHLETNKGMVFVVGVDQIEKTGSDEDSNVVEELVAHPTDDLVNSPKHYATDPSGVECIQIKRKMSANLGDSFKYCWRVGKKWDDKQDLEKSLWYINDAIEHDVPVWLDYGFDLETEALIQQVLKHREGWQYMFINALYWSDLEEAKRAVEIGLKEFVDVHRFNK